MRAAPYICISAIILFSSTGANAEETNQYPHLAFCSEARISYSNGVTYCVVYAEDRFAYRRTDLERSPLFKDQIGSVRIGGHEFAVTRGEGACDMDPMADRNRTELEAERAERIQWGNGFFTSEKDGIGYSITDNFTVAAQSTGKATLNLSF